VSVKDAHTDDPHHLFRQRGCSAQEQYDSAAHLLQWWVELCYLDRSERMPRSVHDDIASFPTASRFKRYWNYESAWKPLIDNPCMISISPPEKPVIETMSRSKLQWRRIVSLLLSKHRISFTDTKLLEMANGSVKWGNCICLCPRSDVPLVVRRNGNNYR